MQEHSLRDLVGRLGAADRELYEERAAIRQFDGLQPRDLAEAWRCSTCCASAPPRCSASGW